MVFHKEKHLKTIAFYQDLNINIDMASMSISWIIITSLLPYAPISPLSSLNIRQQRETQRYIFQSLCFPKELWYFEMLKQIWLYRIFAFWLIFFLHPHKRRPRLSSPVNNLNKGEEFNLLGQTTKFFWAKHNLLSK